MDRTFRLALAGRELNYRFLDEDCPAYFRDFIVSETRETPDLETTEEDLRRWAHLVPFEHSRAYLEQRLMVLKLSEYLCRRKACVIHACAVIRRGRAWLFTASSGTGKTTLYRNWRRYCGEEARILCGDMPFVSVREDGSVRICPSPWNGKENYGSLLEAPLGGILFLSQGTENRMIRLGAAEAAAPLYTRFMFIGDTAGTLGSVGSIEEAVLKSAPVWHFINRGDADSAVVSCRAVDEYLSEKTAGETEPSGEGERL